jgi:sensor histidine kinase YesM
MLHPKLRNWLHRYRVHLLTWSSITAIHIAITPFRGPFILPEVITAVVSVGYAVVFYISGLVVFPRLMNKRIGSGILSFLALSAFFFIFSYLIWYIVPDRIGVYDNRPQGLSLATDLFNISLNYLIGVFAGFGYYLHTSSKWRIIRNHELELKNLETLKANQILEAKHLKTERDKLKAERKMLKVEQELVKKQKLLVKNQWNEHTTFNFFNALYLSVHRDNEKAGEAILLFSNFLEYTLKLQVDQLVAIQDEINHINNYLEIQKLLKKSVYSKFDISGSLEGVKIQALTLFTFVENAFKHGTVNDPENPVEMKLEINGKINFNVKNKKNLRSIKSTGVGYDNLQQMLNLTYPGSHHLNIENSEKNYSATLILENDKIYSN